MVASFVGQGTQFEGTPSGSVMNVAYPASGIQAGDTAVVVWSSTNAGIPHDQTANGWVNIHRHSSTNDTVQPNLYVGYHVCDGTENGTSEAFTSYNTFTMARIMVFRGVNPASLVLGTWAQPTTGTTTPLTGVTMPATGSVLVYGAAINSSAVTSTPPSTPAAFTESMDRTTGTRSASSGYLIWSGSGSAGTVSVGWSGNARSQGILVGFPASVAAAPKDDFFQFL